MGADQYTKVGGKAVEGDRVRAPEVVAVFLGDAKEIVELERGGRWGHVRWRQGDRHRPGGNGRRWRGTGRSRPWRHRRRRREWRGRLWGWRPRQGGCLRFGP